MRTRLPRLGAVTALALVLASCGGGSTTDPAATAESTEVATEVATEDETPDAASAAESEEEPEEESPSDDVTTSSEDGARPGLVLAGAASAAEGLSARTEFRTEATTPDGDLLVEGSGVTSADGALQFTLLLSGTVADDLPTDGPAEIEIRVVDGVLYQRFPGFTEMLGADVSWLAFDLAELGAEFEGVLEQTRAGTPGDALAMLRDATEVEEVGTEDINGVATTHYRALVDQQALLESQGLDSSELGAAAAGLDSPVPIDVWVDAEGLVRRVVSEVSSDDGVARSTFDVLEYGIEVDVVPPPADQTASLADLLGDLGQGFGE